MHGPRVAWDLMVSAGSSPESSAGDVQRIRYSGWVTNKSGAPLRVTRWELVRSAELQARLIKEESNVDRAPNAPATPFDLGPGDRVHVTGYMDVNADGITKSQVAAMIDGLQLRLHHADGVEILPFGPPR